MGRKLTRTALDFARTEKLAALAVLSLRLRRELDSPLSEIESASSRLRAHDLSQELESDALRIEAAAALSRRTLERLDDFFLAELSVRADSNYRDSCERAAESR
jgi:HAMP domain-containing protein